MPPEPPECPSEPGKYDLKIFVEIYQPLFYYSTLCRPLFLGTDSDIIHSPGWPDNFPANSSCWYMINCNHGAPKLNINWGNVTNSIIGWKGDDTCGYDF